MTEVQFPSILAGTAVDHRALCHFGARHAVVVHEAQEDLADQLGEWSHYDFDPFTQTLSFGDRSFKAQLLGSHSYESDTWLWAWGNQAYATPELEKVTAAARWLRDASPDRDRAWQLRTRLFPVGEQLSAGGVPCWPLQYAAFAWLRARATFQGDYGTGRFFLTIHDQTLPPAIPHILCLVSARTLVTAPRLRGFVRVRQGPWSRRSRRSDGCHRARPARCRSPVHTTRPGRSSR